MKAMKARQRELIGGGAFRLEVETTKDWAREKREREAEEKRRREFIQAQRDLFEAPMGGN